MRGRNLQNSSVNRLKTKATERTDTKKGKKNCWTVGQYRTIWDSRSGIVCGPVYQRIFPGSSLNLVFTYSLCLEVHDVAHVFVAYLSNISSNRKTGTFFWNGSSDFEAGSSFIFSSSGLKSSSEAPMPLRVLLSRRDSGGVHSVDDLHRLVSEVCISSGFQSSFPGFRRLKLHAWTVVQLTRKPLTLIDFEC